MERLGFSTQEITKLKEAETRSNELVHIERVAMHAVKGLYLDHNGAFTLHREPDLQFARDLLHDEAYHQSKERIMRPISDAYDLLDARTDRLVQTATRRQGRLLELTIVVIVLLGLSATASYLIIARRIVRPLKILAKETKRIEQDHFGAPLPVYSNNELGRLTTAFNSLLFGLRRALAEADSANHRMRVAHKQIDDSINYAGLLQRTILPERQLIQAFADDHFVLWQPRDRVGGDFYIFQKDHGRYLIGIADCAGHGVPGAMMTMLARTAMDRAIHQVGMESPADILATTDTTMRAMLIDSRGSRGIATSMDAGLVFVDRETSLLRFAGARISLYYSDGLTVEELKGDRRALADRKPGQYQDRETSMQPGRSYYLTTDGFLDQAGGESGFGFGKSRFSAMLRDHAGYSPCQQGAAFSKVLAAYRGNLAQRDDITMLCFRCN